MTSELHRPVAKHQRWVRIGILIVGAIVFLAFLGLDPLLRSMTKRDRGEGIPRQGTATVVDLHVAKLDDYERPLPASVLVRFQGNLYLTEKVFGFSELHIKSPAHIRYRVGPSGRVYIDRVEPVAAPKPSP
ncbi:MAG: hypothetical protein JWL77_4672 [Chthonomonadaceae bacterium]|nr:hypothetical protein [Chthonomonadaceae bacterium]